MRGKDPVTRCFEALDSFFCSLSHYGELAVDSMGRGGQRSIREQKERAFCKWGGSTCHYLVDSSCLQRAPMQGSGTEPGCPSSLGQRCYLQQLPDSQRSLGPWEPPCHVGGTVMEDRGS